jgi:hypothetical protein
VAVTSSALFYHSWPPAGYKPAQGTGHRTSVHRANGFTILSKCGFRPLFLNPACHCLSCAGEARVFFFERAFVSMIANDVELRGMLLNGTPGVEVATYTRAYTRKERASHCVECPRGPGDSSLCWWSGCLAKPKSRV